MNDFWSPGLKQPWARIGQRLRRMFFFDGRRGLKKTIDTERRERELSVGPPAWSKTNFRRTDDSQKPANRRRCHSVLRTPCFRPIWWAVKPAHKRRRTTLARRRELCRRHLQRLHEFFSQQPHRSRSRDAG